MPSKRQRVSIIACILVVLAVCAAAWAPARAEESAAPVFAIIDVQKILRESTAVKGLTKRIEAQRDAYQAELSTKEEQLRTADQELARQRTVLSSQVFADKRKELELQVATLQREVRERKRNLDQAFAEGMNKVQAALAKVAAEIAEEKSLDLILTRATVVIVKPEFDITADVLDRLNKGLPELPNPAAKN